MRSFLPILTACLCSAALSGGVWAAGSVASDSMRARPVALTDATSAPTMLRLVRAHGAYTPAQCGHGAFFSDVSAYRWNGKALGHQTWSEHAPVGGGLAYYWTARHGRVWFDGATFYNHSSATVLVAGWCE